VLVVLACLTGLMSLDLLLHLAVGWALFPRTVLGRLRLDVGATLTAVVCLAGLACGLQRLLGWLAPPWPRRRTGLLLGLVLVLFTAGIAAVGATHQAVWLLTSPKSLWDRSGLYSQGFRSSSNLRRIGEALGKYDAEHARFPPGGTFDAQGRGLHGWQTHLLPYIGQEELYRRINLALPWDDDANAEALQTEVPWYQRAGGPQRDEVGRALSHYAANARVLGGDAPALPDLVKGKGATQTIVAGEAAGNYKPWGHPVNWRDPRLGLNRTPDGFGWPEGRLVHFLFADGSVRSFTSDTDPAFLKALAAPEVPR
jgi:prepilin-type processing-associated H-X9-DG protein